MTTSTPAVKLSLDGVCKRFGKTQVLRDISIAVPAGAKTVLIGPAASGKTVLMKCIAGIHQPERGSIHLDGEPLTGISVRERNEKLASTGVLFQQGGLFDSLTVWENICFRLVNNEGMPRKQARELAIETLAKVNLPAANADLLPSELSGGMQKRVGLARVFAGTPSLMLLDEPTAGLDPITTKAIYRVLDRMIDESHATVFAITSDMDSARHEYDYMIMLNEGGVVWHGRTADIDASGNPYVLQLVNGRADGPIRMRLKARI
ncbi:MAG: ATP-binding cassette domain-containing protein [Anderseniella sp.]|jgi:phospholipid/cholesterol/gamma-HCH transport system ATP-binding protein|nr:ATP-binding cassette domain-containing protein [Anderseniella sp.]